ncbi:MAG: pseudouridylate synthase [Acidobacteria bacterium]|nr:pseudouridylate synthase [Acidobacteriota bacterium]
MSRVQINLKAPLPMIEGVGPSSQWLPVGSWKTVLEFLHEQFPLVETTTWAARMERGEVVDETGLVLKPQSPYRVGACVFYYRETDNETRIPFAEQILFENEHILVVDKPHFLPTVPAGRFLKETLLVRLRKQGKPESLVPIHRIDRETAGVVLFSLNPQTRSHYTALFRERKVRKVYEALARTPSSTHAFPITRRSRIVRGEPFFRMKEVQGEPNTETRVELLKRGHCGEKAVSLFQLHPITGKKHQLRLHLAMLGIPIMNDRLYPVYVRDPEGETDFSRPLKLLAKSIAFEDPVTGSEYYFESKQEL